MIHPKPKNKTEEKAYKKESYENQKEDLVAIYKAKGYPEEGLNAFLVNSLKAYPEELKNDGLL